MTQPLQRIRARVFGTVQGVGFRPFVSRLCRRLHLGGLVRNTARGVTLEVEGTPEALEAFFCALQTELPPLAQIERIEQSRLTPTGQRDFVIAQSGGDSKVEALIPPDTATCETCVRELFDPTNRRYRCAFINCTDCGPRFTIIRGIPYDRAQSAMACFALCQDCAAEFADVRSRRYHAQPVCCNACGPKLWFADAHGRPVAGNGVRLAQKALEQGKIVAVKGIGGFHLCCRTQEAAVRRLRTLKHRSDKPLAVMARDLDAAQRLCAVSQAQRTLLTSFRRPIVLCEKKDGGALLHLSENAYLGLLLPYAPVHHLLFDSAPFDALVMTSANESGLPIVSGNDEALTALRDVCDGFLLHDRAIDNRCDDSLVYAYEKGAYFVRRSRGYVPQPIALDALQTPLLACGAEQKASFCLAAHGRAFPSAHIGDLKNLETLEHYKAQEAHFETLFSIRPQAVICDRHPDYLSTRFAAQYAKERGVPLFFAQHHHAHMVSCMADNALTGDVIGVIFDGAGLGEDGGVWGGEFLYGDESRVSRMGSLRPFPLCGGDAAAVEPVRAAAGLLFSHNIPVQEVFPEHGAYQALLQAKINCPQTTSVGRLFDAAAAILGLCARNTYESRAPMLLQSLAMRAPEAPAYPAHLLSGGGRFMLDTSALVRGMLRDRHGGVPAAAIAQGFHLFLADGTLQMCRALREKTHCQRVVLSGGVFLNLHLLALVTQALRSDGFAVYCHQRVSPSDEGLSLGQAVIAQRRL